MDSWEQIVQDLYKVYYAIDKPALQKKVLSIINRIRRNAHVTQQEIDLAMSLAYRNAEFPGDEVGRWDE